MENRKMWVLLPDGREIFCRAGVLRLAECIARPLFFLKIPGFRKKMRPSGKNPLRTPAWLRK